MMQQHVKDVAPARLGELLGPAEGQYQVVFTDNMVNDPGNPCVDVYDTYDFTLDQPVDQVCLEMVATGGPVTAGMLWAQLTSVTECKGYPVYATVSGGSSFAEACITSLPAGDYTVLVGSEALTWPISYSLTIVTPAPVSGANQVADDTCSYTLCPG